MTLVHSYINYFSTAFNLPVILKFMSRPEITLQNGSYLVKYIYYILNIWFNKMQATKLLCNSFYHYLKTKYVKK